MADVLNKICAQTLKDLALRKEQTSLSELEQRCTTVEKPRGFLNALREKHNAGTPALIAEIKKASPSKGLIREDFTPSTLAQNYDDGGAACLSVLTDTPFFQGSMDYLEQAKKSVTLPILRKDFMLDPYQIIEARSIGADCILLIMAALHDKEAKDLYSLAKEFDMDVLIEVHNQEELDRSLALQPDLLGVNARNLKTLEVSLETSHTLVKNIPDSCFKIAESGIYSHDHLQELQTSGYQGFLVGESLMRQDNVTEATKNLLGTT